jgi:hypothetical protein
MENFLHRQRRLHREKAEEAMNKNENLPDDNVITNTYGVAQETPPVTESPKEKSDETH